MHEIDPEDEDFTRALIRRRLGFARHMAVTYLEQARGGIQLLTVEQVNAYTAALVALDALGKVLDTTEDRDP